MQKLIYIHVYILDICVLFQALKEWRVVGTYRENHAKDGDTNVSATGIAEIQVDKSDCKARPLEFNPDQHKILVSEFKYLYTALTRARVNVWLFDESEEARAPMFEYFQKRGVVVVKQKDSIASLEGKFAQKSDKDKWKKQGHSLYDKGLWKAASKCFAMADEEIWVKKCEAYEQASIAATLKSEPRKSRIEFANAAKLFLQINMKDEAEKCLINAQERVLLAELHEKSKNVSININEHTLGKVSGNVTLPLPQKPPVLKFLIFCWVGRGLIGLIPALEFQLYDMRFSFPKLTVWLPS